MVCELGLFVKCPQPEMIEAIGLSDLNFAVVDMEHTPLGPRDLYPLVLAAEARKLSLVVRIPAKQDMYFKWCRDLNISRIQVPHIETVEDVKYAIYHSYFSPMGGRGLCRFTRASNFSTIPKNDYLNIANASNRLILQIEGVRAVDNLPDILNHLNPNMSIFIGPYDLSQSLGIPGEIWDDRVLSKMNEIINQCQDFGIEVGTFTDTLAGLNYWKLNGMSFIEYSSDLNIFIDAANELASKIR